MLSQVDHRDRWATSMPLTLCAALGLILFAYVAGIYTIPAFGYTEGLYIEISREMLNGSSWILPHLDGAIYVEKPPLLYWLEAASFWVFGLKIWAARLISVTSALVAVLAIWRMLRRLDQSSVGFWAALVLVTSPGWIVMAHTATFDMLLSASITVSLLAFYVAEQTDESRWYIIGWVAAAGSFMAKGPVGPVLVGLVLFMLTLVERNPRRLWRLLYPSTGLIVFLLIIAGWSAAAVFKKSNFLHEFYWVEQFGRYLGTRVPRDYSTGPAWFYLPWLLVGVGPWSLILPFTLKSVKVLRPNQRRQLRFGLTWGLSILLFFSFSVDKAPQYLLPALPGFAIAASVVLQQWFQTSRTWRLLPTIGPALLSIAALIYLLIHPQLPALTSAAIIVSVIMVAMALFLAARKRQRHGILVAGLAFLPLVIAVVPIEATAQRQSSLQPAAQAIANSNLSKAPVVLYRHYDRFANLPFLIKRRVWIYNPNSAELYYAYHQNKEAFPFLDRTELKRLLVHTNIWLITENWYWRIVRRDIPARCRTTTVAFSNVRLLELFKGCSLEHIH